MCMHVQEARRRAEAIQAASLKAAQRGSARIIKQRNAADKKKAGQAAAPPEDKQAAKNGLERAATSLPEEFFDPSSLRSILGESSA